MASTNTPYTELVRLLVDGEAVSAGVTNRSAQDLAQRTQYLRESLSQLAAGQALLHLDAPLQAGMPIGTPVYLSGTTYRPAQALSGAGDVPAPESISVGMLYSKSTDTNGTVVLGGRFILADWTVVTEDGTSTAGAYYVTASVAGKLTRSRGVVGVYVGSLATDGSFILQPRQPAYNDHTHRVFTLVGSPAGTVTDPGVGGTHVVTTPNTAVRGWLPANNTYFPGWTTGVQIPTTAKFGYNLTHSGDAALFGNFPPSPTDSAVSVQGGLTVTPSPMFINSYGVWWLDDTYGNAPWPVDYSVTTSAADIQYWATHATTTVSATGVTSLIGRAGSALAIEVVNSGGSGATSGALQLNVPTLLPVSNGADDSHLAVKSTTGNASTKGAVAARIKAGANVAITATHGDGSAGYYGTLTIAANTGTGSGDTASLVLLSSAVNTVVSDYSMTQLPVGLTSAPVWGMDVSELAAATVTMTPILWIYGGASLQLPATFTYQTKIVTPSAGGVVLATPTWSTATRVSTVTTVSGKVYAISLPTLSVARGSRVAVRLNRAGSTDGYTGAIGILRVAYTSV